MASKGLDNRGMVFINDNTIFGGCDFSYRSIIINKYYSDRLSFEFTRESILHEIAHAMIEPNPRSPKDLKYHYHDDLWRATLESIGGDPTLFDEDGFRIWIIDEQDWEFLIFE